MDLGLANLMTGLAAVVAGWAGVRGLNAWRTEMVGRRKTELAEEVLAVLPGQGHPNMGALSRFG